jgi:hypothetical protein
VENTLTEFEFVKEAKFIGMFLLYDLLFFKPNSSVNWELIMFRDMGLIPCSIDGVYTLKLTEGLIG